MMIIFTMTTFDLRGGCTQWFVGRKVEILFLKLDQWTVDRYTLGELHWSIAGKRMIIFNHLFEFLFFLLKCKKVKVGLGGPCLQNAPRPMG